MSRIEMNRSREAATLFALALAAVTTSSARGGTTIEATVDTPMIDRWMYPFNKTPGQRLTASTFGAFVPPTFDNRDGQILLAFGTAGAIPIGQGASSYQVLSATLTMTNDQADAFFYDPTQDPYTAFLAPSDPDFVEDADLGQSLELFGTGYRGGFTSASFPEDGPWGFGDPTSAGIRNAFALGFDELGEPVDVSNSVLEAWDPEPWAVGTVDGLTPGSLVPGNSAMVFDINVADPNVQGYFRDALDAGKIDFCLTSFTFVIPMGGDFPSFYCKENPLVLDGLVSAGRLTLEVEMVDALCSADLTGPAGAPDGVVAILDLLELLGQWGGSGTADLTGPVGEPDGVVAILDLLELLGAWGACD